MQSTIITAAAVAVGAAALKLEEPLQTVLAQTGHEVDPCETYKFSYECLGKKVDEVLGAIKDGIDEHRADCLVTADMLRGSILDGVKATRE